MIDRRAIALLSAGHACVDLCQGAIPALLPALIVAQHLSYAAAAGLVFAANAASSVIQPLFGHFADRLNIPWLMPVGVLIAGSGLALTSVAPGYWFMALCMCISGIGIAAFHPEAARVTHYIAGSRKATGMSMFSVGGNIGFALGPLVMTALLVIAGLRGTPAIMAPLAVTAFLLFLRSSRMTVVRDETMLQSKSEGSRSDAWGPFLRLTTALMCRSMVFYGLNTFLPLYWIAVLHRSQEEGGIALSVLLLVGLAGTLLGGRLADRYGRRLVVLTALGILTPSLLLFVCSHECDGGNGPGVFAQPRWDGIRGHPGFSRLGWRYCRSGAGASGRRVWHCHYAGEPGIDSGGGVSVRFHAASRCDKGAAQWEDDKMPTLNIFLPFPPLSSVFLVERYFRCQSGCWR